MVIEKSLSQLRRIHTAREVLMGGYIVWNKIEENQSRPRSANRD